MNKVVPGDAPRSDAGDGPYSGIGRDLPSPELRRDYEDLIMGIVSEDVVREEIRAAAELASGAYSNATKLAYRRDWTAFERWCANHGLPALPADPKAVAVYLAREARSGKSLSTVQRRLAAIRFKHRANGHPVPASQVLHDVVRGIVREKGRAGKPKTPLLNADLEAVITAIPARMSREEAEQRLESIFAGEPLPPDAGRSRRGLLDTRDRALLLLLFGGALRRSDVEAIRLGNVSIHEVSIERERTVDGKRTVETVFLPAIDATIHESKGNQVGLRETIAIVGKPEGDAAFCPVRAVRAWLGEAGLDLVRDAEHPLFVPIDRNGRLVLRTGQRGSMRKPGILPLSGDSIARIVKRRVEAAGLDPAGFAAHSLRSGMLTSASAAGADIVDLARQARHKSLQTTMRYVRHKDTWQRHPAAKIGK